MSRYPAYNVGTGPLALPLSVKDAKKQCEIPQENTYHDNHIEELIEEATHVLEQDTGRKFVEQTIDVIYEGFPSGSVTCNWRTIQLPFPPLQSVSWVKYNDANGVEQTLDESTYVVRNKRFPGEILLKENQSWPTTDNNGESVTIQIVVGYGKASTMPKEVKRAVARLVYITFMDRGISDFGRGFTVDPEDALYKSLVERLKIGEEFNVYDLSAKPHQGYFRMGKLWHY